MLPKKRKSKIQNLIDKLRGKKPTLKKIMQNNHLLINQVMNLRQLDIQYIMFLELKILY